MTPFTDVCALKKDASRADNPGCVLWVGTH